MFHKYLVILAGSRAGQAPPLHPVRVTFLAGLAYNRARQEALRLSGPIQFPRLRWAAIVYLLVWGTAYSVYWGAQDLILFCNIAVILTCAGLWLGNSLLLSTQAVSTMLIGPLWGLDLAWRVATGGQSLIGGTEYMLDTHYPLWVRLLSCDHLVMPVLLLWVLWRVGYDRRAWAVQTALAGVVLVLSRFITPEKNLNFSRTDLFFHRAWGPPPVHMAFILLLISVLLYWPAHAVLCKIYPPTAAENPPANPA